MDWADVAAHAETYLALAACALAAGATVGILLGSWAAHSRAARSPILAAANLGRVIPSIAVLTFMLPILGVGFIPALVALSLLAIAPVTINTDLGFRSVAPAVIDAACGMGMTSRQQLLRVEWPLAFPVIYAGVRTAATEVIASAVLAAFIGAGGLGEYITTGLQANEPNVLWTGVIAVAVLAFTAELLFALAGRRLGEAR